MNLKSYLQNIYVSALLLNDDLVVKAVADHGPFDTLLDVGCWDGEKTEPMREAGKVKTMLGIELIAEAAKQAEKRGIKTVAISADTETWPWKDNSIDCVVSNQVVEHLTDLDHYFSEAARVLKPGGYLISSTNNLSSWHNLFSLLMGWTPFDMTNSSKIGVGIGNPLAIHRGEKQEGGDSWTHKCVYTARWLFEWQALHGLKRVRLYTAGYHPLPAKVGMRLQTNAAFIITVTQKEALKK